MKSLDDPDFGACTRRQFTKTVTVGGGAALLGSLFAGRTFAQATKTASPAGRTEAEVELDALATTHPHLYAICSDALAQLKYSFVLVASGKHSGGENDFAGACQSFTATRKPRSKAAYKKGASELLAAPQAKREMHFKHYAGIVPATFLATRAAALPRSPKPAKLATADDLRAFRVRSASVIDKHDAEQVARKRQAEKDTAARKAHDKDLEAAKQWKHVEFFITEVSCIENTGGLFEGTDEIAMGGVSVGTTGGTKKINQFRVKDGFDTDSDSNTKRYKGGKRFALLDIHPTAKLPHEYVVTVAMAEIDGGGFGDFLAKLWDKVKSYVTTALAAAGGAIAGALSLSWLPGIGTAIGAIVGAFIGWLASVFHNDDDIVGHHTRVLRLNHVTESFYEKADLTRPMGIPVTMDFTDAGHYRVTGGWRLVKS